MNETGEIWKPVIGYEGLYEVSNLGNVRTVPRNYKYGTLGNCILSQHVFKNRYKYVHLRKDKKRTWKTVHRLVAVAFIPNPNNLPEVNHLDENRGNNNLSNLEWCTRKHNANWGTAIQRASSKKFNHKSCSKVTAKLSISGEIIETYPSIHEAARANGICYSQIAECCNKTNKHITAGGFMWKHLTI